MRRIRPAAVAFAAVFALASCKKLGPPNPPAPLTVEPALAADHPDAEAIGRAVLADGGSAADAAIATALALGVENPSSSGLGGGGFAVAWDAAEQRAYALDFRERAPAGATVGHYLRANGTVDSAKSRVGCYAVAIPGEPAGLEALHQKFGKLPWERLVIPAQKLANTGAKVSPYMARAIKNETEEIAKHPALRDMLTRDGGGPLVEGDTFRNEELSATLANLARDGAGSFYRGTIAKSISDACNKEPGSVGIDDLAAYHPIWRAPIVSRWRGYDIITVPPPSSGGVVMIEMLHILEPVNFDREGKDAAASYHLLVEAMKNGFADRAGLFGDPDFVDVPVEELTSQSYAAKLRNQIDGTRTHAPGFYGHPGVHTSTEDHGTSHISVVDAHGNAVAMTTSVNDWFGSMVVAREIGVVLNDTIDDFTFKGSANTYGLIGSEKNFLEKGKRPVSSMAPTIVLQDKRVRLVAGGAGGPKITSAVLQTLLGVLAEDRSVEDAVNAPRVHHQWSPDVLQMEPQIPQVIADDLEKHGHELSPAPYLAAVEAVEVKDGKATAADDPRKRHPPTDAGSAAKPAAAATKAPAKPAASAVATPASTTH